MEGTYDLTLLFGSFGVAALAAYAAFDLGGRIVLFDGGEARFWLGLGALAVGSCIWAAHFIGMKAFGLPLPLSFDLRLSLLSWVAAVLVALLALILIGRDGLGTAGTTGGSALIGVGLCIVHYSGVFALRLVPQIRYDSELFSASMFLAVMAAITLLVIGATARRLPLGQLLAARLSGALLSGAAISAMYCTGMTAAQFPAGAACAPGNELSGNWIGLPLAGFVACVTVVMLLLSMLDAIRLKVHRRVQRERFEARFRGGLARG